MTTRLVASTGLRATWITDTVLSSRLRTYARVPLGAKATPVGSSTERDRAGDGQATQIEH